MPEPESILISGQRHVLFHAGGKRGDHLAAALALCVEALEAVEYLAPGDVCEWCGHGGEDSAAHRQRGHADDCAHGAALTDVRARLARR